MQHLPRYAFGAALLTGLVLLLPRPVSAGWSSNVPGWAPSQRVTLVDRTNETAAGTGTWFDVSGYKTAAIYVYSSSYTCTSPCSAGKFSAELQTTPDGGTTAFKVGGVSGSVGSCGGGGSTIDLCDTGVLAPYLTMSNPMGETLRATWSVTSSPTGSFWIKLVLRDPT